VNEIPIRRVRFPRTTAAERKRWVKRYRAANLSQRDFATRHGMSVSALVRWLAEDDDRPGGQSDFQWQEISVAGVEPQSGWAAELAFKDGCTLRLSAQAAGVVLEPWLQSRQ
jgi:hypothetical protein